MPRRNDAVFVPTIVSSRQAPSDVPPPARTDTARWFADRASNRASAPQAPFAYGEVLMMDQHSTYCR